MLSVQNYSYHNHTDFSDGIDSLIAMVKRAKEIGFAELGISDHLIVHKNMYQSPSWADMQQKSAAYIYNADFKSILDKYRYHCDEIRRLSRSENFKLYIGFEVDYFTYDGWEEEFKWFVSQLDYDYLQSGNHFFCNESCEKIINMANFLLLCQDNQLQYKYIAQHFSILKKAVESRMFKFLAHFDYLKRFCGNAYRFDLFKNDIAVVLDGLQQTQTALEVSTKGLRKAGELYPGAEILQETAKRDIAVIINDDAHCAAELGMSFDKAEAELVKYGITKRLKF